MHFPVLLRSHQKIFSSAQTAFKRIPDIQSQLLSAASQTDAYFFIRSLLRGFHRIVQKIPENTGQIKIRKKKLPGKTDIA